MVQIIVMQQIVIEINDFMLVLLDFGGGIAKPRRTANSNRMVVCAIPTLGILFLRNAFIATIPAETIMQPSG